MEVNLSPELHAQLEQWKAQTGREIDDLVADAMTGYFDELSRTREMLDSRYDTVRNGEIAMVEGEAAFALLKKRTEDQRRRA